MTTASPAARQTKSVSSSQATTILLLLYGSLVLSYVDRAVFALSLKPIKAALHLTDTQLGTLTGFAFAICYAAFSPIAGRLGDRYSRKRVLMAAIAVWSLATMATALAGSFPMMFLVRGVVGAGEAAVLPLAVTLIGDTRREPSARHRAVGIFLSAGMVGQIAALLFGGALVQHLPALGLLAPWQTVFILAGLVGFAMILIIGLFMSDPPREAPSAGLKDVESRSAFAFARSNARLLLTLYGGLSFLQMPMITVSGWIILALERQHGWSAGQAGLYLSLTGGTAAILGSFMSGRVIRAVEGRFGPTAPLIVGVATAAAFALFTSLGLRTNDPVVSIGCIALGFVFALGPSACAFAIMAEALPPGVRAQLAGFNTMSNAVICNTLGAFAVGVLSDRVFRSEAGLVDALAVLQAGAIAIGGAIVLSGLGGYTRRMRLLSTAAAAEAHRLANVPLDPTAVNRAAYERTAK